jgi:cation transport ATPase
MFGTSVLNGEHYLNFYALLPAEESETVILDVGRMKCGGCSASVKRILLANPRVHTAAVNLLTECAVVRYGRGDSNGDGQAMALDLTETLTSKV